MSKTNILLPLVIFMLLFNADTGFCEIKSNPKVEEAKEKVVEGDAIGAESGQSLSDLRAKADGGDHHAQYALGGMYDAGIGVSRDESEAIKWYIKATEQGSQEALEALERIRSRRQAAAKFDREMASIVQVEYKDKYHPVVGARDLRPVIQVEGKRRSVRKAKFNFAQKGGVSFKEGYIEIEELRLSSQSIGGGLNREFHFQARLKPSADLENCFVAITLTPDVGKGGLLFHEIPDLKAGEWKFVRFAVSTGLTGSGGGSSIRYFSNGLAVFRKSRFDQMQAARERSTRIKR
jgi:hypothetical protein